VASLIGLFVVPFVSAAIVQLFGSAKESGKRLPLILSVLPLLILLYDPYSWIGKEIHVPWLPSMGVDFHLKVDFLSLLFLYLTAIVVPFAVVAISWKETKFPNALCGLIFFSQAFLIGFFTSRDLVLFAIFWEAMLLPLYLIILFWGDARRQEAALKFIIYMIAGSSLMIVAILALQQGASSGTFDLDTLAHTAAALPKAHWLFAIFALAFAVKTPLFPFHAWLPEAYTQAPTSGTILLSGLLSKAGIYGFLRVSMELFPQLLKEWSMPLVGFAIAGVLYAAIAAWMQNDYKKLLAYASLSHVNLILVGVFLWGTIGHTGAILQSFNHGITIAALFLLAGWLEERLRNRSMEKFSGLAKYMPQLCWLTLVFVLASVAVPGSNNFIGELLIFFALFELNPWWAALLGTSVILAVLYMLRWMQKMYFAQPSAYEAQWIDIGKKEIAIALPLMAIIFGIGIYPAPLLKEIESSSARTIAVSALLEMKDGTGLQQKQNYTKLQ